MSLATLEADFVKGLGFVEKYVLPAAVVALDFIPGVPGFVPVLLGKMPDLIANAEAMFPGDGKGSIKQEYFMKTAELAAADVAGVSTGAQAETWAKVAPALDPLLTLVIKAVNEFGSTPVFVDTNAQLSAGTPA